MARNATTRTTAKAATPATTRKPGKVATVTHGPDGTILVNPPYMLPNKHGRFGPYVTATERRPDALGWTFSHELGKVYVMDGSAGRATADMTRVGELVELLESMGVPVDVKLTATGKARTGKAATAPATDTAPAPVKAATTRTRGKAAAAPVNPLAALLRAAGLDETMIAAAVAAATGEAATVAAAPVKASGKPATRTRATAATPEVTVSASKQGTRVYTLPEGMRVKAAGKAVRQAIAADVRAGGTCKGGTWHVYADRNARTLTVENEGHKVSADVDAIVTAAIA